MGSGETSPTMVSVHQELMIRVGSPPGSAVMLDTPYGFEENAEEISAKALNYFAVNVGHPLKLVSVRDFATADAEQVERLLNAVRAASYIFSGPGSPSYARRQWASTMLPDLFRAVVGGGGCITFASAAATTLGRFALPVYEIYKVGEAPHWHEGLDVMRALDLDVAVITHYDNTEGGTHDTRYCYMGARRLAVLEAQLPAGTVILGVAEHTAAILDGGADTLTVKGRGFVALRSGGREEFFPAPEVVALDRFREARGQPTAGQDATPVAAASGKGADQSFDDALGARDSRAALAALLEVEERLFSGAAGGEAAHLRSEFRGMLVRLADAAQSGLADPREQVAPFVELALRLRDAARAGKRFAEADAVRDTLLDCGIEIRDTRDGTDWLLTQVTRSAGGL
jgi:hypothetical protein